MVCDTGAQEHAAARITVFTQLLNEYNP